MRIHRASRVGERWEGVRTELEKAYEFALGAAQAEESFVFVVHHDDLLGRRGEGDAMVATGLLSAARTAALEGWRKGWTANVIAIVDETDDTVVDRWAQSLAAPGSGVTGELLRLGPDHLGKALP